MKEIVKVRKKLLNNLRRHPTYYQGPCLSNDVMDKTGPMRYVLVTLREQRCCSESNIVRNRIGGEYLRKLSSTLCYRL